MVRIPVQVEKVLELEGAYRPDFNSRSSVYAHISVPVKIDEKDVQIVMLDIYPRRGIMYLGDINPETKMFEFYDPEMHQFAVYTRADNNVVSQVAVPSEQFEKLKTIDEVLNIEGITVKRELIPE